ncbi:Cell surface glycoprotein 1 [Vulpes lagopus]
MGAPPRPHPRGARTSRPHSKLLTPSPPTLLPRPSWSHQRPALSSCPALRPRAPRTPPPSQHPVPEGAPHPSGLPAPGPRGRPAPLRPPSTRSPRAPRTPPPSQHPVPEGAPHPSALPAPGPRGRPAPLRPRSGTYPSADPVGAAASSPHARNPRTCPPACAPSRPAGGCARPGPRGLLCAPCSALPHPPPPSLSSRQPERPRTRRSREHPPAPAPTPLPSPGCEAPHPRLPPTPPPGPGPLPPAPPAPPAVRTVAEKQDQAAAAVARRQVSWRPRLRCGGSESQLAGGLGMRQVLLGLGAGSREVKRGLRAAPGSGFPSSSGTSVSAPKAFSCGPGPGAWRAACLAQSLRWKHPSPPRSAFRATETGTRALGTMA